MDSLCLICFINEFGLKRSMLIKCADDGEFRSIISEEEDQDVMQMELDVLKSQTIKWDKLQ